ncbi:hypothetical protein K461DRAFT_49497 [Myriangium duriaei CBS 260.36]|uniref:Uncharacterized protein n=1 Tax=Myriangium duriaei CBS 260.36 TaxID=1168546 RepID=A0A9P4IZC8_9PEZI|nr:hypothetical protein K461DRAFT_49497 [Myriangium duriaei CBS 260.36]
MDNPPSNSSSPPGAPTTSSSSLASPQATFHPTCYDTSMTIIPNAFLNYSKGTPYCAIDWPALIPNLTKCCIPDAQVGVYQNCTQFCQTTGADQDTLDKFGDCLRYELGVHYRSLQCEVSAGPSIMAQLGPIWTILVLFAYLFS